MSRDSKPPSLFLSQKLVLEDSPRAGNTPCSKFHAHKKMSFNDISLSEHLSLNNDERKCKTPGTSLLTSSLRWSFKPQEGFGESSPESSKQLGNPFLEKLRQKKTEKSKKASSRASDPHEEEEV